jgi:hypothetical protein
MGIRCRGDFSRDPDIGHAPGTVMGHDLVRAESRSNRQGCCFFLDRQCAPPRGTAPPPRWNARSILMADTPATRSPQITERDRIPAAAQAFRAGRTVRARESVDLRAPSQATSFVMLRPRSSPPIAGAFRRPSAYLHTISAPRCPSSMTGSVASQDPNQRAFFQPGARRVRRQENCCAK